MYGSTAFTNSAREYDHRIKSFTRIVPQVVNIQSTHSLTPKATSTVVKPYVSVACNERMDGVFVYVWERICYSYLLVNRIGKQEEICTTDSPLSMINTHTFSSHKYTEKRISSQTGAEFLKKMTLCGEDTRRRGPT